MKNNLKIIPLGGIEEIGKNCTLIEHKDEILIIDFGIKFNKEKILGNIIEYPDFNYLKKNKEKILGILITHGHLDHIGGLPYLLKEINIPVFSSQFTKELITSLFKRNSFKDIKVNLIEKKINLGNFEITPIKVAHSVRDALGFIIKSPIGKIFLTGDFKEIDNQEINFLKNEKLLCVLADSTNANKHNPNIEDDIIIKNLQNIIKNNKRIFISHFSSQTFIIKNILKIAKNNKRFIIPLGRAIENIFTILEKNKELKSYSNIISNINQAKNLSEDKIIFMSTGSQGEKNSALWKIAHKKMRKIKLTEKDTLILSSSVIPGNEIYISDIVNNFFKQGAKVITNRDIPIHKSGHAYKDELKNNLKELNPQFFIPLHGEYQHLIHHKNIALETGIKKEKVFILSNGQKLELQEKQAFLKEKLKLKEKLLLGNQLITNSLVEEKKNLAEQGVLIINLYQQEYENKIKINSMGIVNQRDKNDFHLEIESMMRNEIILENTNNKVIKNKIFKNIHFFFAKKKIISPTSILVNFLN